MWLKISIDQALVILYLVDDVGMSFPTKAKNTLLQPANTAQAARSLPATTV